MSRKIFQNTDFFYRLDALRKHLKLTAYAFTELTGTSHSFYSELKAGRTGPSFKMLVGLLQNVSNLNINWLLFGEGEMFLPGNTKISDQKQAYGWADDLIKMLSTISPERRNAVISLIDNMIKLTDNK